MFEINKDLKETKNLGHFSEDFQYKTAKTYKLKNQNRIRYKKIKKLGGR